VARRGRLSKIDMLPDEATEDVIWVCQQLAERRLTQKDILAEFNERLAEKGIEAVSRDCLKRKSFRLAATQRRMAEAREMFEGLSSQFTAANVDENTVILGEFIKTLIIELLGDETGGRSPKQAMELARAYQATVSAQKISTARRQALEAEAKKMTEKVIEKVTQEAGLSPERAAQIRRDVLGLRAPKENGR